MNRLNQLTALSTPVANALIRLFSSTGALVATSTTDSSGNYSFTRLIAGSGYRVEFGPSTQGAANALTASSVTTNRTVVVNAITTVNGEYALLRTNTLSGQGASGQSVALMPAPYDSTGTQTYASFTKSATCVIDPADGVCKASVVVAGQGSWSIDTASGGIIFAPATGFSGTATSVSYRVTETSSSLTTWNLASVVIAAPIVVPVVVGPTSVSNVVVPSSSASRAVTTGVLVTQVRVTTPGRVTQTGTATINGVTVPAVTCRPVTVTRARSVTMSCALSWSVRQALRRAGVSVYVLTKIVPKNGKTTSTRTVVKLKKVAILPVTR